VTLAIIVQILDFPTVFTHWRTLTPVLAQHRMRRGICHSSANSSLSAGWTDRIRLFPLSGMLEHSSQATIIPVKPKRWRSRSRDDSEASNKRSNRTKPTSPSETHSAYMSFEGWFGCLIPSPSQILCLLTSSSPRPPSFSFALHPRPAPPTSPASLSITTNQPPPLLPLRSSLLLHPSSTTSPHSVRTTPLA